MIFNAFGENFSQYKSSKMKKKPPIHAGIALFYNPRVKLRKKDTIYKMTVWIGISYCVRQYEYYLENGIPFFIYETERDFPENQDGTLNHEQLSLAFEGSYYLDKGKVIDIKLKGKKRMEEQPTAVSIQSLVTDGKSYARLLSSHLKKTK